METFAGDKDGYERWIAQHPDGFVLNKQVLHRATCDHIGPGYDNPTASPKFCSDRRAELTKHARETNGEPALTCMTCSP